MDSEILASRIESQIQSGTLHQNGEYPPPRVPDHELVAPIGRGSYGQVWLARGVTGGRHAVKVVWRRNFSSDRPYEREFRGIVQFEPISRSHPGVVSVLHVGRDDSAECFYYVMELADNASTTGNAKSGNPRDEPSKAESHSAAAIRTLPSYAPRTLASDLRARGRMPVADIVALGIQLANALGHLHRHSLVHRDVKPSNVIFVEGHAQLADIGLVAGMDEAHSFVGTEGFIPPEGPGTEQADLFSLGRLLYEAATGKDRSEFPMLPGDLDRWPAPEREALLELNEVLARACAAKPADRHANAAELAGDLNTILAGRSVRRAYGLERRLRQARRITAAAGVILLLSVMLVWIQRQQQHRSEERAIREASLRNRAELAERETQNQLYSALLEQARATVLTGELGQRTHALDAVRRAGSISNSAALRGVAVAALALPDLSFEREFPRSNYTLLKLAPAFDRMAVGRGTGPVEIRSTADQRLLATLAPSTNFPAYYGIWSPGGRYLAIKRDYAANGRLADWEIWDTTGPKRVLLLHNVVYGAISFPGSLPQLIAGQSDGSVTIWNLATGQPTRSLRLDRPATLLQFSPKGDRFASLAPKNSELVLAIHRTADGSVLASQQFPERVNEVAWHPDGRWLAVPDLNSAVYHMDADTGEAIVLGKHKAQAVRAVFTPDGRYLFTGGWEKELVCWDARALRRAFTISLDSYDLQLSADGETCAVFTESTVELRSFERPTFLREFAEELGGGRKFAAFSSDGRWLAASGGERLALWDLNGNGPGAVVDQEGETRVSFANDNLVFADRPGECFRWHFVPETSGAAPHLEPLALAKPQGFVSLCVVSNGVVLTSTHGSMLKSFDQLATTEGSRADTVDGKNGTSPDGHWLAMFRPYTPILYVHRLPDMARVATLTNEADIIRFQFSPNGEELAVGCRDGVEFWNTKTWRRTHRIADANTLVYSPDGKTYWLATEFHGGGLHDARTGQLLLPLPANTVPLAVSPDGRRLAASVGPGRVQLWDLELMHAKLRELGLDWQAREQSSQAIR